METSTSEDGDSESSSQFSIYYNYIYKYRIPFLIILYLVACTKPLQEGKVRVKHVAKTKPEKQHVVVQVAPPVKKKKKKIYLTFDDGPNKGTRNVLDIVKDEKIPVTFFIVGEHVYASINQNITWDSLSATQGIDLCSHSYTHALHNKFETFYQSPDTVISDFQRAQDSLQFKNNIVRTPGRNTWRMDSIQFTDLKKSKAAVDSLQKAGFVVMGWDLEWHYDHKDLSVKNTADDVIRQIDSVFNNRKTKSADHLVLLAHDQVYQKSKDSIELRQLIQKLKLKDEYELSLATNYPGASN
jgi:peptidoglycan/xylan/chitin deacetylase (PgdA/CDA1 family)